MVQSKAMKPIGLLILGALHVIPYFLVIYGGETILHGVGWMAAGIMLCVEVNT